MSANTMEKNIDLKVSKLAQNIIGSEIIKLAAEVNEKIKQGEKVYNFTIGDFNPKMFSLISPQRYFGSRNHLKNPKSVESSSAVLNMIHNNA